VLTPLDDLLAHQTPETFDHVATSDRNFFDRYYFNCHDLEGRVILVLAMGQYPNLDVTDCFASAVFAGTQYVVRGSRLLGGDRLQTSVGPMAVHVIEGLRRLQIACEPNAWGLSFELTFEGVTPPFQEPRFQRRAGPRVVQDYQRLTQNGRWRGWIEIEGRRFEVEPQGWWGARDHSWGIRPVGEREAPGARAAAQGPASFYWNWSPQQYADSCLMYTVSEEADGSRWHEAAALLSPYGSDRPPETLTRIEHAIDLVPGTRRFGGGGFSFRRSSGEELRVRAHPLAVFHMFGVGYGGEWRHGVYHGPLTVEGERWDLRDAATVARVAGLDETLCRFERSDGATGFGVVEFACFGPYLPLGLPTATAVSPA
jgi:hypothetical protein